MLISEAEVAKLKTDVKAIKLESRQYVLVRHPKLISPVCIMWTHDKHELVLLRADNQVFVGEQFKVDLTIVDTLILNSEHPGHERVFHIVVDEKINKLRLMQTYFPNNYSLELSIRDEQ